MKSFSQFIIEKKGDVPLNPDEKAAERSIIKNFNKKNKKKDNRPFADPDEVKTTNRPQSTKDTMAKNIAKQDIEKSSGRESGRIGSEGSGKVKDTVKPEQAKGYKPKGKIKLGDTTIGGEVKVTKPQGTPSGNESRPLGRVVQRGIPKKGLELGDIDYTDAEDLANQRRARINPKTGKATRKGVENYAQSRGGFQRTTGKPRNMPPAEWAKRSRDAKNIAANPNSAAYKEIEAKINQSDYAGRRAKGATPEELRQIKSDIKNSKTINQKVDDAIDDVVKKPKVKGKTTRVKAPKTVDQIKAEINSRPPDGRSRNKPPSGNKFKSTKTPSAPPVDPPTTNIKLDSKYKSTRNFGPNWWNTTNKGFNVSSTTKTSIGTKTPTGTKLTSNTKGQQWQGPQPSKKINFKNFLDKTNRKTFGKTALKKALPGGVKVGGPLAALDFGMTFAGEKSKGRTNLGATLASTAKVASSALGYGAGAALGTGWASIPAGLAGGYLTRSITDKAIDTVFKPKNAPVIATNNQKPKKAITVGISLDKGGNFANTRSSGVPDKSTKKKEKVKT